MVDWDRVSVRGGEEEDVVKEAVISARAPEGNCRLTNRRLHVAIYASRTQKTSWSSPSTDMILPLFHLFDSTIG